MLPKFIKLRITWSTLVSLYNKYCFNNDLNLEIGTSKTIILFKTFHIRALTLVNDLEPMGTLKGYYT